MSPKINPRAVVSPNSFNIYELFNRHNFDIPDYQRDFVWKESQVAQLWTDLINHHKRITVSDVIRISPDAYFLGAMVTLKNEESGKLEVIDGQQRLTTLTCISSVLYELLNNLSVENPDLAGLKDQVNRITGEYVAGCWKTKVNIGDPETNDFLLNSCVIRRTKEERQNYWNNDPVAAQMLKIKNAPARKIRNAIEYSLSRVEEFIKDLGTDEEKFKRLASLVQLITECVVILNIETNNHTTAYHLFESLNYRGMPLTQADLIKNEIIKLATNSNVRSEVIESWTNVKNSLNTHDTINLPDFLHYSYLSRYEHIKASSLFDNVKSKALSITATRYSEEIYDDAQALDKLAHGDSMLWSEETNNMLKDIREVLNVKLSYVSLLAGYRKFRSRQKCF